MKISLVVPVYNEEESIELFYQEVKNKLKDYEVEIVFINDGSKDNTETLIEALAKQDILVKSYSFTRNFGKEPALFAGLTYATGDAIIPIDVDLQDPIEVIPEMINEWKNGADIVLAKRIDRSSDSYLKKLTASLFYKLHNKISHLKIEENVGDFRLLDKSIVNHILTLPERNLFMKGILSFVGGNVKIIEYKREERSAGKTKFSGWKLWTLALEGITSFSTVPLKVWTYLGLIVASLSFIFGMTIIIKKIFFNIPIPGYPSLLVSILFLGGIQLIGIGILGEYIGRIYIEVKQRPKFIIKSIRDKNDN